MVSVWGKELQLKDGPLARSCLAQRRTDLLKKGRTVLEGFANMIRRALKQPDSFDSTTLRDLEEFVLSTFPREEYLKEEPARRL